MRQKKQDRLREGKAEGQLLISMAGDGEDSSDNRILTIKPVNGGIRAGAISSPWIAPTSGYQNSYTVDVEGLWQSHLYYKSHDATRHALFRLLISTRTSRGVQLYSVSAEYHMTRGGSRALDYRLAKTPADSP